jgi:hypothetical protein
MKNFFKQCTANHCNPLHWLENVAPKIVQLFSTLLTDSKGHGTSHRLKDDGLLTGIAFIESVLMNLIILRCS